MGTHAKFCNQCNSELPDSSLWFCNIVCEKEFRDENQEFHVVLIDGLANTRIEEICPVIEFKDDIDRNCLIVHNGSYEYVFDKNNVLKFEITPCTCLVEFMEIERWK